MQNFRKSATTAVQSFFKRLPAKNKLPFFTLSFTLAALIVTIVAVQQQQTLIQQAAEKEICDEDTVVVTGEENEVNTVITDEPTASIQQGSGAATNGKNSEQAKNGIKGQLLVKYKTGKDKKSAEDKVKKRKGKLKKRNDKIRVDVMQVPENEETNTINDLRNDPNVEYVERDYPGFASFTPNDKYFVEQYALNNTGQTIGGAQPTKGKNDIDIDAPEAWDKTQGGVTIAILDSGIDAKHPDLSGKIVKAKNFSGTPDGDQFGHGTFIAGIIAANTNNNEGIAGACPKCKLFDGKVLDTSGSIASVEPMADAIHWAVDEGAKVINISVVFQGNSRVLEDAVNYAWGKGVVVVAGAGNCGGDNFAQEGCKAKNPIMYPASYQNAIAVSAIDSNGNKAAFSESGDWVDVAAPGVDIASTTPTSKYNLGGGNGVLNYSYFSGTSFAAPHVAAVAGLVMSQGISASETRNRIESTATAMSGSGSKHGLINAKEAVGSTASEPSISDNPKPTKDKSNKPTKANKPTCKPKKDKGDKGDKKNTPTPKKDNTNREPSDPQKAACRMLPSLPFCNNTQSNNNTNNGSKNPCTTSNTPNKNGNSKDGQTNTSNKETQVQTGQINSDETSDTKITINGKSVTLHNAGTSIAEDINTGGQQGGNHETNINVNGNGENQTSNQSGGNGNQQTNNPCDSTGNNNTKNNDKNNAESGKKNNNNNNNGGNGGNGGGGQSFVCRFLPRIKFCQDESKRNEDARKKKEADDKKKKDAEEKKKKDEEAKKKQDKDVKGVTDDQVTAIIKLCLNQANPVACSPDMRAVADVNGDAKVTQADLTLYLNSK